MAQFSVHVDAYGYLLLLVLVISLIYLRTDMHLFCLSPLIIFDLIAWNKPNQFFLKKTINQDPEDPKLLILSSVVSGFNLLIPGIFNVCGWLERYESTGTGVYVSIFRQEKCTQIIHILLCSHTTSSSHFS